VEKIERLYSTMSRDKELGIGPLLQHQYRGRPLNRCAPIT
jgi:hypothetical protein